MITAGAPAVDDPSVYEALRRIDKSQLVVFAGPSLVDSPLFEYAAHLLLPPVKDGDLIAALDAGGSPAVILLIDGYFGAGQAVSLTEIQEVLHRGVRLYGCASMGALRAVEARPWGMTGLGEIFTAYLTGSRTADENVALLHDDTYRGLTAPTVNVDLLCELLVAEGLPQEQCHEFGRRSRQLYFGDRSYSALRHLARECFDRRGGETSALEMTLAYLAPAQHHRWDAKRRDAESALRDVVLGLAPRTNSGEVVPVPASLAALLPKGSAL
ncbi:hypothetical protein LN042_22175 [Kitasatospora sp. RB6PN24]|uniref:TfuA-like protein n=1 Tax=Kitasatospora humi TaxID=2893891 RepID=UPI001E38DAF3|nr:TfuA-like protein [Kitasatospora humi]MCC9309747.1 hypothetical protein [Kitasatospora humi]